MNLKLTDLKKEYLPKVFKIAEIAVKLNFEKEGLSLSKYDEVISEELARLKERYENILVGKEKGKVLVALVDGEPVGTMGISELSESIIKIFQKAKLDFVENETTEFCLAYILPDFQGVGIGKKFINELFEHLKTTKYKYYSLYSGYKFTIPIWQKFFGKQTKVLEKYFGGEDDCYVWLKGI